MVRPTPSPVVVQSEGTVDLTVDHIIAWEQLGAYVPRE